MAKLYGEILSSALMTFDKSFARANGQPLDSTEVYYSLAAAQEYAAGAGAYVGQKIVVVENGVVTHYSIENEAGALKELGSKPVGDNSTIVVAEDGTVSLKGVGTLTFERELEDGGKEAIQYQPLMTAAGLIWVEPSKTTVEGLATLIEGLSSRVKAIEDDYLKAEDIANMATDAEVEAAVKVETDRAEAAEKGLGERIDGVDGKFANYVTTESFGTFKTENTQAIADAKSGAETTAANALAAARIEISKEIDDDVKVAKNRADEAYSLAETKVDVEDYEADKVLDKADRDAIREIAEGVKSRVDTFLDTEGVAEIVDSLKDIKDELDKMAEVTELTDALALKADKSALEGVEERVKAIEDAPYVTKGQLDEVDGKFASYTNTEALTTLLAGKQDVIPENTYDTYGSASTAKGEAIEAAAAAAASLYATIETVNGIDGRVAELEKIDHEAYALASDVEAHVQEANGKFATKDELTAHGTAADAKYATKDELAPVVTTAGNAYTAVTNLETRFDEIVAVGGEPNAINKIQVNGSELSIENKTVNIVVPTKASDLTDDTGFDARITAAQSAADAAQGTANSAVSAAAQAQSEVDALETEVGGIQTTVAGHTTTLSGYGTRIGALEQADITHATEYSELKAVVSGHTADIAKKADQTALNDAVARIVGNETDIKTLKETTIPGINSEIAKKANSADVYTKNEVNAITGAVEEGKTIVQMISEAKTAATYDDTEIRGLITAETNRAKGVEEDFEGRIAEMEAFWEAADDPEGTIDKLAEIVNYINSDKSGALTMAADIQKNTDAIAAINNTETGILAVAKEYVNDQIDAIPVATAETLGLVKYDNSTIKMNESQQLHVAQVSTDVLVQGEFELILNGGSAKA